MTINKDIVFMKISLKIILILYLLIFIKNYDDRETIYGLNYDIYNYSKISEPITQEEVDEALAKQIKLQYNIKGDKKENQEQINEKVELIRDCEKSYQAITKINKNVVGWIKIPGTLIDYPIMYKNDNDYYLSHDSNGNKDINGSIFLDKDSDGKWGMINLIHGHNMKSGVMFGSLIEYKQKDFYKKHSIIEICTESGYKQYNIFSVFIFDASNEILKMNFNNAYEYSSYVEYLSNRSIYQLDKPKSFDDIIILNTCSYEFTNAHLLICAYK